jgi:hypothetical protein
MADYGIYNGSAIIAGFAAPTEVISNEPTFMSDALSLKRSAAKRPVQRWEVSSNLEPLSAGAHKLSSLFARMGTSGIFQIITPQNYGGRLVRTCTAAVTATGSAGASQVTTSGVNGLIPDGTFIRFASHSKVYMTNGDHSTAGTLNIYPPLRAAVGAGSAMTYKEDVLMQVSLDNSAVAGMKYRDGILMDMGFIKLIERL